MKKVSVSGYAVCEVIQEVEVEDNATAQEIREKAEEEFKGLEDQMQKNEVRPYHRRYPLR